MLIKTVADLIEALKECNQDLPVSLFVDDDTYQITYVDKSIAGRIELNGEDV